MAGLGRVGGVVEQRDLGAVGQLRQVSVLGGVDRVGPLEDRADRGQLHPGRLDDLVEPVDVLVNVGREPAGGGRLVELVAVLDPDRVDVEPVGRRDRLIQPDEEGTLGGAVRLIGDRQGAAEVTSGANSSRPLVS